MTKRLILALDPGQTKCKSILFTYDGTVIGSGHCEGKDVEATYADLGAGRSDACMAEAARQALAGIDCNELIISNVGIVRWQHVDTTKTVTDYMYFNEFEAGRALSGVTDGIVVLAGTGALVHGRTAAGESFVLDGLGPLLGDFGSASDIGYRAIRAAAISQWHVRHHTAISRPVRLALGGAEENDVRGQSLGGFANKQHNRAYVADLSRIVTAAAREGDRVALGILKDAAAALAGTVFDVIAHLGIGDEDYDLIGTGGMLLNSPLYWNMLCNEVHKFAPKLRPVISDLPTVVGIGSLALQSAFPDDWQKRVEVLHNSARAWYATGAV